MRDELGRDGHGGSPLLHRLRQRAIDADRFVDAYRRYCRPITPGRAWLIVRGLAGLDRYYTGCERLSLMNEGLALTPGSSALTIRERQRAVTRDAIRDAAIEVASGTGFAAMTIEKVAQRAGVSPSTVYRYFTDRDELLTALVAWLYERQIQQNSIHTVSSSDELAEYQEQFMADLDSIDGPFRGLFRALVVSRVGQPTAWSGRQQRLDYWRSLLDEVTGHLDPDEARVAKAAVVYLTGGLPWLTMADESGLDGAEAGRAVGWAIRTLIADLRTRNEKQKAAAKRRRASRREERKS